MKRVSLVLVFITAASALDAPKFKPKPVFQYETDGIRVSVPSANEPKVAAFGPESIQAAAKYLEEGALTWVREKSCINCHTTGPYMSERTAWISPFGPPNEEILANFIEAMPSKLKPIKATERNGHTYHPGTFTSVWRSLGLAEWDKHVTGQTSDHTDRSLRDMFERQSANGSFVTYGEVEVPHITTDFELSLQAARAITAAPGWLAGIHDDELLGRIDRFKAWLKQPELKNDFDRILRLQLAHYMPKLVPQVERDAALALLSSKQHADGGWSTRDMSALSDWHFEISDLVTDVITNLPDSASPLSDAYMTALAIVLMRQNDIPAADERIQRGLAWLKKEQRVSGRWWMESLYRGNYSYITYIATCQALKALALCGEIQ